MRFIGLISVFSLLLFACNHTENNEEGNTGNFMEVAPSQLELDEIALLEQPQIIQAFFSIDPALIGADFCYNYETLSQLIIYGQTTGDWSKFEITENYLTAYQNDCGVLLEFMTFDLGTKKRAFLSQMNGVAQQFNYLELDNTTQKWRSRTHFPRPQITDYFSSLTPDKKELVNSYGADFLYINPLTESITFIFSEWAMQMAMGEKQEEAFDQPVDFDFELLTQENKFVLAPVDIKKAAAKTKNYFVAYAGETFTNDAFKSKYQKIASSLAVFNLSNTFKPFDTTNYMVYFPQDTFDLSYMEQFEPRNGFWFYKAGKEPLDIDAELDAVAIIEQARGYFDNNN